MMIMMIMLIMMMMIEKMIMMMMSMMMTTVRITRKMSMTRKKRMRLRLRKDTTPFVWPMHHTERALSTLASQLNSTGRFWGSNVGAASEPYPQMNLSYLDLSKTTII